MIIYNYDDIQLNFVLQKIDLWLLICKIPIR